MNCATMYKVIEKTTLINFSLCELRPIGSSRSNSHPVKHDIDFNVGDIIICEPWGAVIKLIAIKKDAIVKSILRVNEGKKYRYLIKESDNLSIFDYCIIDSNYYFSLDEKISGFLTFDNNSEYPEFILQLYVGQ